MKLLLALHVFGGSFGSAWHWWEIAVGLDCVVTSAQADEVIRRNEI
jgi:hypothetical protein